MRKQLLAARIAELKKLLQAAPVVNADFKVAARLKTAETVPVELPPS